MVICPGFIVWKGMDGRHYWRLTDRGGGLLNRPVDGAEDTRKLAVKAARTERLKYCRGR